MSWKERLALALGLAQYGSSLDERLQLKGKLDLYLKNPITHEIVDERHTPNTVVDGGEIILAELLANSAVDAAAHAPGASTPSASLKNGLTTIAVGLSGTAVGQNDYTLLDTTDMISYYKTISDIDVGVSGNDNQITLETTFATSEALLTGSNPAALQEAGVFIGTAPVAVVGVSPGTAFPTGEKDSSARMFNRTTFGTITKSSSFALTLRWTITLGALT